jgi:hypothetical protein
MVLNADALNAKYAKVSFIIVEIFLRFAKALCSAILSLVDFGDLLIFFYLKRF